jgi:hypothetical protein
MYRPAAHRRQALAPVPSPGGTTGSAKTDPSHRSSAQAGGRTGGAVKSGCAPAQAGCAYVLLPGGQAAHAAGPVAPVALPTRPAPHALHSALLLVFAFVLYRPATHSVHVRAPGEPPVSVTDPAGHASHPPVGVTRSVGGVGHRSSQ